MLVVPDVKDTNLWEQFTANKDYISQRNRCSRCQRYELMRAIHSCVPRRYLTIIVVPDVKDTNLWEQFTAFLWVRLLRFRLFQMSKIRTYESNSQLFDSEYPTTVSCSRCQRYELMRAIHSMRESGYSIGGVVPDVKDTNLWEQFTAGFPWAYGDFSLFQMSKIRTYESNSQRYLNNRKMFSSCSRCQRYELMRAIHSWKQTLTIFILVVPDVKDTNLWEQFTA